MKIIHRTLGSFAIVVCLATGCSDKQPADAKSGSAQSKSSQAAASPAPLEQVLAQWQQGDQAGAIQRFIETDWQSGPAFSAGSSFSHRETDLPSMSASAREKLVGEVMVQLKDLKQLANAVRDKGVAAAATDKEMARRCFTKLDEYGAALDQPDGLKIVQLTAQSIRKMAAAETAKLGK